MGFLNLIGGIKTLIGIIILVALGGYIFILHRDINKAEARVVEVTQQRDDAGRARDAAISANAISDATITQLLQEKTDIQNSLDNLKLTRQKDQAVLTQLRASIKAQSTVPENKVPVSPVVSDTIAKIQLERTKRMSPVK
jgi:ribonuclease D